MLTANHKTNIPVDSSWVRLRRWARVENLGAHIFLAVIMIIVFIPLFWMVGTTFKDRLEFATHSAAIIPSHFSLVNYEYMLTAIDNLPTYMLNSFILAGGWCWCRSSSPPWRAMPLPACSSASAT